MEALKEKKRIKYECEEHLEDFGYKNQPPNDLGDYPADQWASYISRLNLNEDDWQDMYWSYIEYLRDVKALTDDEIMGPE